MPSQRTRPLPPGALATYESGEAMATPTSFIVTLKDEMGMAIPAVWVSVHLEGSGLLRPEGAHDSQRFTFQRTDESGVVQFMWLPGLGTPPGPISLQASTARGGSLVIRRL